MRKRRYRGVAAMLVAVLLGTATFVAPVRAQEMDISRSHLVPSLLPTVVNILAHSAVSADPQTTMRASSDSSGDSFQIKDSAGSGFIVDATGVIVTNWHVVDGAYEIFVTFSDGQRAKAGLLNAARIIDIALLKVDVGHPLPAIAWGDSAKVQVGDPVLAIGNPLGVGLSVTAGIVSALNRNIRDTPYDDFIQTDAPINHGNSGGPLFNLQGKLIGINTALISTTSSSAGLGFAIPSNDARFIIDRLMHFGWVRPGYLGMKVQQVTPDMAIALGMAEPTGSIVAWLADDAPAIKAGLRVGDVIVSLDGSVPTDERELLRRIASGLPGTRVTLGIIRDGVPRTLQATLDQWPRMEWEKRDGPIKVVEPHWNIPPDLGIIGVPLTDELRARNEIAPGPPGVLVTGVAQNADAARSGLAPGDVILRVGAEPVTTIDDMQRGIDAARKERRLYAMFLVLPKTSQDVGNKAPGPKWLALRVSG